AATLRLASLLGGVLLFARIFRHLILAATDVCILHYLSPITRDSYRRSLGATVTPETIGHGGKNGPSDVALRDIAVSHHELIRLNGSERLSLGATTRRPLEAVCFPAC